MGIALRGLIERNWRLVFILLALFVDSLAVFVSGLAAFSIRSSILALPPLPIEVFLQATLLFGSVLLFLGMLVGLYRTSFRTNIRTQYREASKAYLYSFVAVVLVLFVTRAEFFPPRFTLFFFLILPFSFGMGRYLLNRLNRKMQQMGFGVHPALVFGPEHQAIDLAQRFQRYPELGYRIRGVVPSDENSNGAFSESPSRSNVIVQEAGFPTIHFSNLEETIRSTRIDRIFIPMIRPESNGFARVREFCEKYYVKLKLVSEDSEDLLRFSFVKDIAGISLYAPPRTRITFVKEKSKRIFDITVSLLVILVLAPLFIFIPLAILLEGGRPIFFRQRRALVHGGEVFECLKFRSMVKDAETQQQEMYSQNETSGGLFKMENDPRMTRVGRFIRRFSLDELPQIFNVLSGEMSLVGPRPLSLSDLANITPENKLNGYYRLRAKAKPGITGLWQVCGRREVAFNEMVLLDLYYIENQSVMFDLEILFATIPVVLFGKGAY